MTYPTVFKLDDCAIIRAERVAIIYPASRCAAPGCGDKIKGTGKYQTMWRLHLSSDPPSYVHVHDMCFDEENLGVVDWVGA